MPSAGRWRSGMHMTARREGSVGWTRYERVRARRCGWRNAPACLKDVKPDSTRVAAELNANLRNAFATVREKCDGIFRLHLNNAIGADDIERAGRSVHRRQTIGRT
jgi:hypothetical protein